MDPWNGRFNAEVYDRFVREQRIYRVLNQNLVELGGVENARRILDLACGTGATAIECLKRMTVDAELVGVDGSEDMVEVARANAQDPRAEFVVAPAASVGDVVTGSFDRVVCNASFWQFPAARPVLDALSRLVEPHGRFVFNVPVERVLGETAPVHALQAALARVLEERTGGALARPAAMLNVERLAEDAAEAGFEITGRERFVYRGEQRELADLMSIPAMLEPLAPDLSPTEREAAMNQARSRIDPQQRVEVPWLYFIVEKRD
jgi:ubiquinone/menaquinone biosynthesis C-methylase UbiE